MKSGFWAIGLGLLAAVALGWAPRSSMAQAAAGDVRISHSGLTLNAVLDGPVANASVVLLVHGTLAHNAMEIMTHQRKLLRERGQSVLAVNLSLGVNDRKGMYDCAVPHRHTDEMALEEIGVWIKWLADQKPKSVTLAGHSRGGASVARFQGSRNSAEVNRLVLMAPTTFDASAVAADYLSRYKLPLASVLDRAKALVVARKGGEFMSDVDFLYCPKAKVSAASFVSYYGGEGLDAPSWLAKIRVPVLVGIAAADTVVRGLEERVQAAPKAGKVATAKIDGADHFFQDLFGEDLADQIAEFIKAN